MVVQKRSLDPQKVQARGVAVAITPDCSAVFNPVFSNLNSREITHLNCTVNFGDQSPREDVTSTAKKVHNFKAGEQTRRRQRISLLQRGIDCLITEFHYNISTAVSFFKKSYLFALKLTVSKTMQIA